MSKIFDNLFLGNYQDSKNERFLKRNGITHILCVGIELKPIFPDQYKYLHIPAYDSPGYKLSRYFEQVADFIHNAMENEGGKVFVHCYMGISRSTTSILAYMIKYQKVPPLKGRLFIKSKRGIIWPNDGFMRQLENYAKKLGVVDGKVSLKNLASSTATTTSFPAIKKEEPKLLEVKSATVTGNSLWKSGVIGETKSANKDYYCKSCGIKVFNTKDIEHDVNRTAGNNQCNVVYLKTLPGVLAAKSPGGKVFCPNTKCNSILGYADQKGGKCGCGHQLDKVYAVYPLRIIASKAKNPVTQPRPQANAETQALSQTIKAW